MLARHKATAAVAATLVVAGWALFVATAPLLGVALALVAVGAAVASAALADAVTTFGVARVLPAGIRAVLCEQTLLQLIREGNLGRVLAPYRPLALALDDGEVQVYLARAPPAVRNRLLQPGLGRLLPAGAQVLLFGRDGAGAAAEIATPALPRGRRGPADDGGSAFASAAPPSTVARRGARRGGVAAAPQPSPAMSASTLSPADSRASSSPLGSDDAGASRPAPRPPTPGAALAGALAPTPSPTGDGGDGGGDDWWSGVVSDVLRTRVLDGAARRMDAAGATAAATLDAALASTLVAVALIAAAALRRAAGGLPASSVRATPLALVTRIAPWAAAAAWGVLAARTLVDRARRAERPATAEAMAAARARALTALQSLLDAMRREGAAVAAGSGGGGGDASAAFNAALREAYLRTDGGAPGAVVAALPSPAAAPAPGDSMSGGRSRAQPRRALRFDDDDDDGRGGGARSPVAAALRDVAPMAARVALVLTALLAVRRLLHWRRVGSVAPPARQ